MPDITMCQNKECRLNKTCYRFLALPSEVQSYAGFEYNKINNRCEYFWDVTLKEMEKCRRKI
jgi:hypothetical protein